MAQSDYTALSSGCQVVRTSRSDVSYLLDEETPARMLHNLAVFGCSDSCK